MEINDVEHLLLGTQYEPFIGSLQKITLKNHIYDNHFKMGTEQLGYFSIKIRKNNEQNVINSINLLKIIEDKENLLNQNIGIFENNNNIIIISEWLEGKQPIDNNRNSLPIFFSKLATLNKNNMIKGPYTSMYLDYTYFDTINELIDWEINYHKKYFIENMDKKLVLDILENLKNGISCIINEDMNCGNLYITNDENYKIIDTEWIIKGSNLYQFQHFDYFALDRKKWYKITDEAEECYKAYFEALGISNKDANDQIRAIELLNVLRENTYWKYTGKENDKEMERRINIVIEKKKYI